GIENVSLIHLNRSSHKLRPTVKTGMCLLRVSRLVIKGIVCILFKRLGVEVGPSQDPTHLRFYNAAKKTHGVHVADGSFSSNQINTTFLRLFYD
ncbi:10908_t:CDS:1, partial [Acaulospora colombiana]